MFFGVPAAAGGTLLSALLLIPADLPPPPQPDENPITEDKRVLGKILFWDEQLSSDNTVSCGTCHMPEASGADFRNLRNPGVDGVFGTPDDGFGSPGVVKTQTDGSFNAGGVFAGNAQVTPRIAPPTIMAAYFTELFWDGRAGPQFIDPQSGAVSLEWNGALESQAVGPVLSDVEMAHAGRDWSEAIGKLGRVVPLALATDVPADMAGAISNGERYADLFQRAFGDPGITAARVAWAIAAYQRTLIPDQTPWDRHQAGEADAMTPDQIRGLEAFEAAGCNFCHTPPTFADDLFANIGLRPWTEDPGRAGVTGHESDRGRFKTPSLRNVGLRTAFMHNGMFNDLTQVVNFYAQLPGSPPMVMENLDPVIPLLDVEESEIPFMVDFMANGLTDPRVRGAQFPFDRPTLFSNRAGGFLAIDHTSGVSGSAGLRPELIAIDPPLIGNLEFRIGVWRALGGAEAWVGVSSSPPAGGVIVPEYTLANQSMPGTLPATGYATLHLPLTPGSFADAQETYFQWFVRDPDAPGGIAASQAVRVTFFCPPGGCTPTCDADVDCDGSADQGDVACIILAIAGDFSCFCGDDPDFNQDGSADQGDVASVIQVVAGAPCP